MSMLTKSTLYFWFSTPNKTLMNMNTEVMEEADVNGGEDKCHDPTLPYDATKLHPLLLFWLRDPG